MHNKGGWEINFKKLEAALVIKGFPLDVLVL